MGGGPGAGPAAHGAGGDERARRRQARPAIRRRAMGKQAFRPVFLKQADNKRKGRSVSIAATVIVRPHALPAGVAARRKVDFFAGRGRKW
jgi:hypothetical protein